MSEVTKDLSEKTEKLIEHLKNTGCSSCAFAAGAIYSQQKIIEILEKKAGVNNERVSTASTN